MILKHMYLSSLASVSGVQISTVIADINSKLHNDVVMTCVVGQRRLKMKNSLHVLWLTQCPTGGGR